MAHFAKMNGNIVSEVIVVNNADAPDEATGVAFCKSLFGQDTEWKQTSYNDSFRKNYAGIGYTYDAMRDAFIAPQPGPNWTLDETTCQWIDPHPTGP